MLDLTASNPTQAALDYPAEAIVRALADPRALLYDPQPAGMWSAREAVAAYYGERGVAVSPERILLTSSTSEAYSYLFKLLCEPGDEILVPRPSYPLFEYLAALESVRVQQYPLLYDSPDEPLSGPEARAQWMLDLPAMESLITPRCRAVVVVNPNNPTGSFLKRAQWERLLHLCAAHGLAVLSDEVFADFALRPDLRRLATVIGDPPVLCFAMSGLSKVAGLPQMKLGWIAVNGPATLRAEAIERLEWIADTYLSVGTPVQCALPRLLSLARDVQRAIGVRTAGNLALLHDVMGAQSPFRPLDVEGGWYAPVEAPRVRTEEEWALDSLRQANVLLQPGYFYDFEREAFLVFSLLTPPDDFAEGIRRVSRLV